MPRPVPSGLGGEEGLEDPLPLLGAQPRAVVAHGDRGSPGCPSSSARSQRISIAAGSARGRGRYPGCCGRPAPAGRGRRRSAGPRRRAPRAARPPARPRRPPGAPRPSRQTSARSQARTSRRDRRRIGPDVLEEAVQVVLRRLEPGDEVERLRPVLDLQGEHLQADLAAMQRVAALVAQAGDHLADGRQPLGLQRPLLRLLQGRDVVADRQHAGLAAEARRGPGWPIRPGAGRRPAARIG